MKSHPNLKYNSMQEAGNLLSCLKLIGNVKIFDNFHPCWPLAFKSPSRIVERKLNRSQITSSCEHSEPTTSLFLLSPSPKVTIQQPELRTSPSIRTNLKILNSKDFYLFPTSKWFAVFQSRCKLTSSEVGVSLKIVLKSWFYVMSLKNWISYLNTDLCLEYKGLLRHLSLQSKSEQHTT